MEVALKGSSTATIERTTKRSEVAKAYVAGFLDGDGSILAQIVRREEYKNKFQIRVSIVFFQKTKRHWCLELLQKEVGGVLRKRTDEMSELAITGAAPVKALLEALLPYLRVKKGTAELVISIIKAKDQVSTRGDFIEVCKKVDKVAEITESKKRTITAAVVAEALGLREEEAKEKA